MWCLLPSSVFHAFKAGTCPAIVHEQHRNACRALPVCTHLCGAKLAQKLFIYIVMLNTGTPVRRWRDASIFTNMRLLRGALDRIAAASR
jgi:hypothetical protein